MSHSVTNDTALARHVAPHVVLVLLLCIEIHKLLNFHDGLPGSSQVTTLGRFNLLTALTLVALHLLSIRLVQEVQQETLIRACIILFIRSVHGFASKQ